MKQESSLWPAAGFAAATFDGTILHFLYDWTGGNILVTPFSGVNESTWEHMKLLFWPLFLFALIQRSSFRGQQNYWCVKLAEILLGLLLIPVLFYTYHGVFGESRDWVNISIFCISSFNAAISLSPYLCAASSVVSVERILSRSSGCSAIILAISAGTSPRPSAAKFKNSLRCCSFTSK